MKNFFKFCPDLPDLYYDDPQKPDCSEPYYGESRSQDYLYADADVSYYANVSSPDEGDGLGYYSDKRSKFIEYPDSE